MQSAVWAAGAHCAASSGDGVITRIDPHRNKVTGTVTGFKAPIGLAVGFRSLWVADLDAKTIDRVNLRSGRVVARLRAVGFRFAPESASARSGSETTAAACCGSGRRADANGSRFPQRRRWRLYPDGHSLGDNFGTLPVTYTPFLRPALTGSPPN